MKLPNISVDNIVAEVYYGKISNTSTVEEIAVLHMELVEANNEERLYTFKTKIELTTGGEYGYTFRVMPKHEMILDNSDLNLVKWITE